MGGRRAPRLCRRGDASANADEELAGGDRALLMGELPSYAPLLRAGFHSTSKAAHSVLPQLGHAFASLATVALHEGHRVGLETVERTLQTKKTMPPTTAMTMAKTIS